MSAESQVLQLSNAGVYRAILIGGLAAGVLDITAAFLNSGLRGRSPMWVLQSISSGLLGGASFNGGLITAALGVALHFFIAFVACAVYVALSLKFSVLAQRVIVCGVVYGIAVYLFMYGVVLPLTFNRSFFQPLSAVVISLLIHISCVGLPIAVVTGWYLKSNAQP
jgi:hypothetical protein